MTKDGKLEPEDLLACLPKCPPHKPIRRIFGPFHPQFVADHREFLTKMAEGMSDYVCSECGMACSHRPSKGL